MIKRSRVKIGRKHADAIWMDLGVKNLIVIKGRLGYIMCGYLNLKAAEKFKDAAAKITGVSTIRDAVNARIASCTSAAKRLGVYKGQPVKEALKLIA